MSSKYRIVVLGSGGVGKSALTIRFIQGNFVEKYDPTIEDSYNKQVDVDDTAYMLDILDTAGQDEYSSMRDQYMRGGHGFILVYSITDPSSLDNCNAFYDQLKQIKEEDNKPYPIVLVGNKCDLEDERGVEKEEGETLAETYNASFFETSAKDGLNVEEIFHELVRKINKNINEESAEDEDKTGDDDNAEEKPKAAPKKKKKGFCIIL